MPEISKSKEIDKNINHLEQHKNPSDSNNESSNSSEDEAKRSSKLILSLKPSSPGSPILTLDTKLEKLVKTKKKPPDTVKLEKPPNTLIIPIIFFCVIIVILAIILSTPCSLPATMSSLSPFEKYITEIDKLQQQFPKQKKRLWSIIKASVRHILNESHSDYPSVILMASDVRISTTSLCLAKLITAKFESAQQSKPVNFVADVESMKSLPHDDQKKRLDDHLKSNFHMQKSVIINNLQLLSPEAALLLHGYCDNDNAPYKDVMMVLMFYTDTSAGQIVDPDQPNHVEIYLENLWSNNLHVDKVSALMSRVANNIVVVSNEDSNMVNSFCSDV